MTPSILRSALRAGCIVAATTSLLSAQGASQKLLDAFHVRAATTATLTLPTASVPGFEVGIRLDARAYTLQLHAHDMRAPDYQLVATTANGDVPMRRSPNTTYRGQVAGFPESVVAASLFRGQLTALIAFEPGVPLWNIQPVTDVDPNADPKLHIVHSDRDRIARGVRCGTDGPPPTVAPAGGTPTLTNAAVTRIHVAEVAIDADNRYYQRRGGSSVSATEAAVMSIMNGVEAIYKRDVAIEYIITRIFVRTTAVYSGGDVSARLSEFRNRWRSTHSRVRRDMAHLFTGVGSFSGIIGVAWLGTVCSSSRGYGASKAYAGYTSSVGLVAHEMGHNWGAGHCDKNPPCYLMCPSLGGCNGGVTRFGASAQAWIRGHRDSRSCLNLSPFGRVGGGIPGRLGNPRFIGEGFIGSSLYPPKITLAQYRPNAPGIFVVGVATAKVPYFGGLLVPRPDVVATLMGNGSPIVLDASALRSVTLPNLWAQAFYRDGAAPQGVSATSGYRIFIR